MTQILKSTRFVLEPLTIAHADEMVTALASTELYTLTGGGPPTLDALRARYARQATGHSPVGDEGWLNWVIRSKASGSAIGYVQATLTRDVDVLTADLAWLVAPRAQGQGAATEASLAALTWLTTQRVQRVRAFIHPSHQASARVAELLGLHATPEMVDGERVWQAVP